MGLLSWPGLQRLGDLILGTERRLRIRVKLTLIALYGYTVSTAVLLYGMDIGVVEAGHGWWLMAYIWLGAPAFYLLVRTDLSTRLGNPSLDLPQCVYALVAILGAYVITGPVRSSVLMLISLVLVFGMFTMSARQVIMLGAGAMLSLGAVMGGLVMLQPDQFDPRLELIKFVLTASALPAVSAVSYHVSQIRSRLLSQKQELAHALAMLQEIASRDELTKLVNRRHMQERLAQEVAAQQRSGQPFCLALLDLDHFKRINDQHGHACGDAVLQHFAGVAQEVLRKTDVLARWGGEEFLLMLPAESLEGAHAALARIRQRLMQPPLAEMDGLPPQLKLTFSAGLTDHPLGEPLHLTLERADRALYAAKSQGRDRFTVRPAPVCAGTNPSLADTRQL